MKAGPVLVILLLVAAFGAGGYILFGDGGNGGVTDTDALEGDDADGPLDDLSGGKVDSPESGGRAERGADPRGADERVAPSRSGRKARGTASVRARFLQEQKAVRGATVSIRQSGHSGEAVGSAKTSSQGRVELKELATGRYRLAIDHPDVPFSYRSPEFSLGSGEQKDLGDLRVPVASGLKGRVVGPSGAVVADAHVTLRNGVLSGLMDFESDKRLGAKTDSRGEFKITRLAKRDWVLAVDHVDHKRHERKLDLDEGAYIDVGTIELEPGRELTGLVVDPAGRAIAGAEVIPQHVTKIGNDQAQFYPKQRAVKKDAQGRFRLRGLQKLVRLKASAKGYQQIEGKSVGEDERTVRLVLEPQRGVRGRVTNAEGHDVRVWLLGVPRSTGPGNVEVPERSSTDVETDGSFFFEGVAPGVYKILADAPGYGASKPRRIRVEERGVDGIELRLVEGPKVEVSVVDHLGGPVQGARVRLRVAETGGSFEGELGSLGRAPQRVQATNAKGVATLAGAWRGRGRLDVSHARFLTSVRDSLLIRDGMNRLTIKLEPGGWVVGKCIDTTGAALPGIEVNVSPRRQPGTQTVRVRRGSNALGGDSSSRKRGRSGKDGTFRLGPLRPGNYVAAGSWDSGDIEFGGSGSRVRFSTGETEADAKADTVVVAGQESSVVLRLARPGKLAGIVRYDGSPVPGARVFARKKDRPATGLAMFGGKQIVADDNGHYSFGKLSAGKWNVSVKPPKGPIATKPVTVEILDGASATQDLELGGGQIRGVVRRKGSSTRGFAGLDVMLAEAGAQRVQQRVMFRVRSDGNDTSTGMSFSPPGAPEPVKIAADGSFEISFVPAGKWTVRVREGDQVTLWAREVEVADRTLRDLGTIDLEPSFPVNLKFLDRDGKAIAFGSASIRKLDAGGKPGESVYTGMARNGVCKVPGLAPGKYQVSFRRIDLSGGNTPVVPMTGELEVSKDGQVSGTELRAAK